MPLDWSRYDAFDWAGSQQLPMTNQEREVIADLAIDLLQIGLEDRQAVWGHASPPGRFAATVIGVARQLVPAFAEQTAGQSDFLGLKIFKNTADGRREGNRATIFHSQNIHSLPGLPNRHIQRSFAAGLYRDPPGNERHYVVQEWIKGETLEELLRRRWTGQAVAGKRIRFLLEQLFGEIVIPLWTRGTVWWDVRDANFCVDETSDHLTMIDVDSLAAYADEILRTPGVWRRRAKGKQTALARLRQLSWRLLQAQRWKGMSKAESQFRIAWNSELEPVLAALGETVKYAEEPQAALVRFLDRLEQTNLLASAGHFQAS